MIQGIRAAASMPVSRLPQPVRFDGKPTKQPLAEGKNTANCPCGGFGEAALAFGGCIAAAIVALVMLFKKGCGFGGS